MQKNNNKISQRSRQRQKMRRKMILIISVSFIGGMLTALVIFFKTSRVDESRAAGNTYMISEEAPVTGMTLDAPLIKTGSMPGPNTLLVRAVKHDEKSSMNNHH